MRTLAFVLLLVGALLAVPGTATATEASLDLTKTVYAGHDGGSSCPGTPSLTDAAGTAITYCFVVTNTGAVPLGGLAVVDPALGVTDADMLVVSGDPAADLAPGGSVVLAYETTLTGDLVNHADAGAFELDADGNPSYDSAVVANGSATVEVDDSTEPVTAAIDLEKNVYAGHDDGAGCPGSDLVTVELDAPVTYCFTVTNTGEAHLANVTVDDPTLGITDADMTLLAGDPTLLAPGATVVWFFETTAGEDLVNVATTTGTPSDDDGDELPEVEPPTDDDDSEVEVDDESEPLTPAIEIQKTVYQDHNAGAGCPGGELVTADVGTEITYCFEVTNIGDSHLADVTVDDTTLGITDADMTLLSGDPTLLAPGDTVVWYYETTLAQDLVNVATTTGTPADEDGNPVDAEPPTDDDDSEVEVDDEQPPETPNPDIEIQKTVYGEFGDGDGGHDGGASCPGEDEWFDTPNAPITYCFVVTNTGDTHLADVTVDDPDIGIDQADMTLLSGDPQLLAPGATAVWFYETILTGELINTATTTGTPADGDGNPIDAEPPTDEDDAAVAEEDVKGEQIEPDIRIDKTVYVGHDDGARCPGRDQIFNKLGTAITYCFIVTNTGDTHLADVQVDDVTLGLTQDQLTLRSGNPSLLAPGASIVWFYETTLDDDLINTATTTGTPADEDGNVIPAAPPTDEDDATVGEEDVLDSVLPRTGFTPTQFAGFGLMLLAAGILILGSTRRQMVSSIANAVTAAPTLWIGHSKAPSLERAAAPRRRPRR